MEVTDKESKNVVEGDDMGIFAKELFNKDRLRAELRGHMQEADHL